MLTPYCNQSPMVSGHQMPALDPNAGMRLAAAMWMAVTWGFQRSLRAASPQEANIAVEHW